MTCTTAECGKPTDLHLCGQCVSDLQQWLDKIPETRQMLFTTMAKLDNTGPKNSEGGGGGSTGSAMPLREGAMDLRYALAIWLGHKATDLATDPHAGGYLEEIKRLTQKAYRLVDLPPETRIVTRCHCGGDVTTHSSPPQPTSSNPDPADIGKCQSCGVVVSTTKKEIQQRILKQAPGPMRSREVVNWIRQNAGHNIAITDVRNWAREGLIRRANNPAEGHPTYAVQDVLRVTYRKIASGKGRQLAS